MTKVNKLSVNKWLLEVYWDSGINDTICHFALLFLRYCFWRRSWEEIWSPFGVGYTPPLSLVNLWRGARFIEILKGRWDRRYSPACSVHSHSLSFTPLRPDPRPGCNSFFTCHQLFFWPYWKTFWWDLQPNGTQSGNWLPVQAWMV